MNSRTQQAQPLKSYNAGLLQGTAYRVLQNTLTETLQPYLLSVPEWKLLGKLTEHTKLRVAEIAAVMQIDPPLVTVLVDSLEKKRFVKRKPDLKDKRAIQIVVTAKGKKLIDELEHIVKTEIRTLLQGITYEEFLAYIKVLTTIVSNGNARPIKKNYLIE